jgi:site-specific DNA-methyltransferase (adenine-specific)
MQLLKGDCLEEMNKIPDGCIDLVLTDPPYGTTACKWDSVIPFEPMWEQLHRVIKGNGAIVLFGSEPFSSALRMSNINRYKYDWYWRKSRPSGFVNAKLKPLKDVEQIMVFSKGTTANGSINNMPYYPQDLEKIDKKWERPKKYFTDSGVNPMRDSHSLARTIEYTNYPRQILDFQMHNSKQLHPTQKPVALLEYLIRTYTNDGETVLDFTMGSGSTGVACVNTGRNFIGIELDSNYYDIACKRIRDAHVAGQQLELNGEAI